jgi:hypothetical protein
MPYIAKTQGLMANEYLASTHDNRFDSYTLSLSAVMDSVTGGMKNLQDDRGNYYVNKGWLLALITSGDEAGKVGPYDSGARDGRQTSSNIVGFNDTFALLTDGDVDVGVLYAGTVKKTNVYVEGTKGTTDGTVMGYCKSATLDILFR